MLLVIIANLGCGKKAPTTLEPTVQTGPAAIAAQPQKDALPDESQPTRSYNKENLKIEVFQVIFTINGKETPLNGEVKSVERIFGKASMLPPGSSGKSRSWKHFGIQCNQIDNRLLFSSI
jgi:hypothetical protein